MYLTIMPCLKWGGHSLPANATLAHAYYSAVASLTGDPYAQYMEGFLHSTNYGQSVSTTSSGKREGDGDQGAAVLYYTFAALAGQTEAELTMGYRHWVGVGVKQNCQDALPWYKSAADKGGLSFLCGLPKKATDHYCSHGTFRVRSTWRPASSPTQTTISRCIWWSVWARLVCHLGSPIFATSSLARESPSPYDRTRMGRRPRVLPFPRRSRRC